jgi:protein-tyrosine phosphatase
MDMDMVMATLMNIVMIDIHNHFIHNVDDGSKDIEMTKKLLFISKEQNVKKIFFTPHVNSSVSKTSREDHIKKFNSLKKIANEIGIEIYLGAEIYLPFRLPELNYEKYKMGDKNILLVEFSTFAETPVYDHVFNLIKRGFRIIIAHVERYEYLKIEDIYELKKIGVFLQVNASSLIKKRRNKDLKRAWNYINSNLIDFVASDSHNTSTRPPNMNIAYKILKKKIGEKKTNDLLNYNALNLLIKD